MRPQLLCTFTYVDRLPISIEDIYKAYEQEHVSNMKCYHYAHLPNNVICIYNTTISERRLKDTISINRKKESNTYYSINALNSLIRILNNGVLDKSYLINWLDYGDSILLSEGEEGYKQIKIKELTI